MRGTDGRREGGLLGLESDIGLMTYQSIVEHTRERLGNFFHQCGRIGARRPALAMALLLGTGVCVGAGAGIADNRMLRAELAQQQAQIAATRRDAQREINALAARMGELQAEANRLNALGERLTRIGQLQDGAANVILRIDGRARMPSPDYDTTLVVPGPTVAGYLTAVPITLVP